MDVFPDMYCWYALWSGSCPVRQHTIDLCCLLTESGACGQNEHKRGDPKSPNAPWILFCSDLFRYITTTYHISILDIYSAITMFDSILS